jgi:hypothetical protein
VREQCYTYNDWTAVTALQAISVYFLLRLSEKDEAATDFDVPLIHTMMVRPFPLPTLTPKINTAAETKPARSRNFAALPLPLTRQTTNMGKLDSRRITPAVRAQSILPNFHSYGIFLMICLVNRTIFILLIISSLFDISAGTAYSGCNSSRHLLEMLLPCTKNLWIAQTKEEWEREYVKGLNLEGKGKRGSRFGDLLRHDVEGQMFEDEIDRWLAGVDEFGVLVMAFASLSEGSEYITG